MFNISDLSFQETEASRELLDRQLDVLQSLRGSGAEAALLKRLEDCVERAHGRPLEPCKSPACAYCATEYADFVYSKTVALAEGHRNPNGRFGVVGTIRCRLFDTGQGSLNSVDLRYVHRWHADDLRKIERHPVIGWLNPRYIEDSSGEIVGVVCHFAALGATDLSKEELQELLSGRTAVAHVVPLTDPRRQLKSLIDLTARREIVIRDQHGQLHLGELSLRRRHRVEAALWLDQYRPSDRLILKSLRRQGDRIVPTPTRRKREDGE